LKKQFLSILFVSFFASINFGQNSKSKGTSSNRQKPNGSLTGTVVERSTFEPLQFATVALYDEEDLITNIQDTTNDINGILIFKEIEPGLYYIG